MLIKISAAIGGKIINAASAARLPTRPVKISTGTINFSGAAITVFFIIAEIRPVCSAKPIPIIETTTIPSGGKPVKLFSISVTIKIKPS